MSPEVGNWPFNSPVVTLERRLAIFADLQTVFSSAKVYCF
jgi:hypothetical protein